MSLGASLAMLRRTRPPSFSEVHEAVLDSDSAGVSGPCCPALRALCSACQVFFGGIVLRR